MSQQDNISVHSHPVAMTLMQALYDFTAEDAPEMSMRRGDQLSVVDMDPALNGWAYCRRRRDNKEGYVPVSYLGSCRSKGKKGGVSRTDSPDHNKRGLKEEGGGHHGQHGHPQHSQPKQQQHGVNAQSNSKRGGGGNNNGHNNSQNHDTSNMAPGHGQHRNVENAHNVHQNQKGSAVGVLHQNQKMSVVDDRDQKVMVCSFHRDFIPSVDDLYRYFGAFGNVTNALQIEHDSKRVPIAKIRYQSAASADTVCSKGNRQQIPSASQGGNIHIRVWRSMMQYQQETQRKYLHGNNRNNGGHHGLNNGGNGGHHGRRMKGSNRRGGNF